MALFTPSRIAVVVLTFSLLSFLWTFGLPRQLAEHSSPIIEHPADEVKLHETIASAPIHQTSHATLLTAAPTPTPTPTLRGDEPKQEDDHRWDDQANKSDHVKEQTSSPRPEKTSIAAIDEDGGRWNDKQESTKKANTDSRLGASASTAPTKLHVETSPAPAAPNTTTTKATPTSSIASAIHSAAPVLGACKEVRNAPHVMVIVKTSKAEISNKLSAHLRGLLSCVPNYAIFSDHAGEVDGVPVYDALRDISSETKLRHDEFREYKIMKADPVYKPDAKKAKDLEKWKILPMVYQAYKMNPHAKFYAFIEADTGLSWTNLLQWATRLDYRIPYYSGAQTFVNHIQFAQRGPGILLSQGAMRRYAKSYDEHYANEWEPQTGKECCGDLMLATALAKAHVELYTSWPLIQGEQPNTLDYSLKQWCVPAVTWHHMENEALSQSWDKQKKWTDKHGWEKPYLYRDAFEEYVGPHLVEQKENWDNLSSDTKIFASKDRHKETKQEAKPEATAITEKTASTPPRRRDENKGGTKESTKEGTKGGTKEGTKEGTKDNKNVDKKPQKANKKPLDWAKIGDMIKEGADSPASCARVCNEVEDCLQWRYTTQGDGECHLSKAIKLGRAIESRDGAPQWTSGWMVPRIKEMARKWECKEVKWRFYQR